MTKAYIYNSLTADERKVYKVLSDEPVYLDEILSETGLGTQKASQALLNLELKRMITQLPGKQFIIKEN
jgi:predicted Rossmann fold nucleotide-binding protein DprA/Smf involved in DNA uptake